MRVPDFWIEGGPLSVLLAPLGWAWAAGAAWRQTRGKAVSVPLKMVCIGNLMVGGAGKTPVALSVARRIEGAQFLSTGYGGSLAGPVKVDAHRDTYDRVGDEALLLADSAPCWMAKDRVAGARAAARHGAHCLVLDDGFQDPVLRHDVALLVVDGHVGFGSGRCMPAGPLREPIAAGLRRADAVVLLGEDRRGALARCGDLPVLRATLEPEAEATALAGRPVIAFAGIGRPQKFFHTLEKLGADVVEAYAFDDHHPYHPHEIGELLDEAARRDASLVTTTKDIVRVPPRLRDAIAVLRMTVTWDDEEALLRVLAPVLAEQ